MCVGVCGRGWGGGGGGGGEGGSFHVDIFVTVIIMLLFLSQFRAYCFRLTVVAADCGVTATVRGGCFLSFFCVFLISFFLSFLSSFPPLSFHSFLFFIIQNGVMC